MVQKSMNEWDEVILKLAGLKDLALNPDDFKPLVPEVMDRALAVARECRDEEWPVPDWVIRDSEGGILFGWGVKEDVHSAVYVSLDGEMRFFEFRGSELIREILFVPGDLKIASP